MYMQEVLACDSKNGPDPLFGIKDVSRLQQLKSFSMARGFTFDYMHTLLLGVVKSVTIMLFDSTNHTSAFYVTPQGNSTKFLHH